MPKVFSEQKRNEIKTQMLEVGLQMIKKYGMKKMSIEEITRAVGIAQGTFYNFFPSKEVFVIEIAKEYQRKINTRIDKLASEKSGLSRDDLGSFYRQIFLEDQKSVFRYLSREDIQTLMARLPEGYFQQLESSRAAMERMLTKVAGRKEKCDLDLIYNWIQLLNITVENKDLLSQIAFERTFDALLKLLLDEVFDTQGEEKP